MIAVEVRYTVKESFISQNEQNISQFLADFKQLSKANFLYHVFASAEPGQFVHVGMYENEETQQEVLNVPSFLRFQQERDEQGLVGEVQIKTLSHLGSSLRSV